MSGKYAFTSTLREVRFHLCHSSPASEATRSFLKRAYPTMKKNNPNIPILIREATGIEPKVWARYGLDPGQTGITQADMVKAMAKKHLGLCQPFTGLSDKEIENDVSKLVMSEPTPVNTPAAHDR